MTCSLETSVVQPPQPHDLLNYRTCSFVPVAENTKGNVLPRLSTVGSGSLLPCYLTEKPSADKAEDRADQRTEHREPEGDVGNDRAMCLYICAHLFAKRRPGARPDLLSCSGRGAASPGQCSATDEFARASPQRFCRCLPASSVFHRRGRNAVK